MYVCMYVGVSVFKQCGHVLSFKFKDFWILDMINLRNITEGFSALLFIVYKLIVDNNFHQL